MSAALIVLDKYLPVPMGTQSYTLKDDDVYYPIVGALSFGFFTMTPISIGRNYRNELPASYIGRPWRLITTAEVDSLYDSAWGNNGVISNASAPPTQAEDPVSAKDERWTGTPPNNESIGITYICFMDADDGTGNLIACFPASLFEQFSPLTPTRY